MITARALEPADLDAVVGLLHAYDRRWFGEPVLTATDVASEWAAPGFDLTTDSEGWTDEDVLVAFATLGTRGAVELAVDATWAGAGLEDTLLARWEDEGRRRGFAILHRHLPTADGPGRSLLQARGWRAVRTGWLLRLEPATPVEAHDLPAGYEVRPMTAADLPSVFAVVRDAFASWSPNPRSYDDWRTGVVDRPDATVGHGQVAVIAGRVVGACLVLDPPAGASADPSDPSAAEAWVPQLAVAAAHRRRGLARELLARTALAARARGVPALALYTHADTGARGLYERFGMVVRHELVEYGLELASA